MSQFSKSTCGNSGEGSIYSTDEDFVEVQELDRRTVKKVYLITYSRADPEKCADRKQFSEIILKSFDPRGDSKVVPCHWAVCKEHHKVDPQTHHYHMCIKFSDNKRWLPSKKYLLQTYGISVHFSDRQLANYISAYRYITKEDNCVLHSKDHPDLDLNRSPRTSQANKSLIKKRRSKCTTKSAACSSGANNTNKAKEKVRRLSKGDVMQVIQNKNIQTDTELLALAACQAEEGLYELKHFIANTPESVYRELISKTWKFVTAKEVLKQQSTCRLERVAESGQGSCVGTCQDQKKWLKMAEQLLRTNRINKYVFAAAVRDLLQKGRGKNRNLMLIGPANCGKTFLLNPLTLIFKTFVNPSSAKYAFVGVENCEAMFLNDLRWSPDMISWAEFLNLLEGQTVRLAAPKSHYAQDIVLSSDMPIFATSIGMIKFVGRTSNEEGENAMMEARWKKFELFVQIPENEQKNAESCARCFSELVFLGADA